MAVTDYYLLDYIYTNGSQYIDTGYKPNGDTRVTMDFKCSGYNSPTGLFGARDAITSNNFNLWIESDLFGAQYYDNDWSSNQKTVNLGTNRFTVDWNKNVCSVQGVSATFTKRTFNTGCNLFLMALNEGGVVDGRNAIGYCYSSTIYNNNVLIRNMVPAKRKSDNVLGMYDLVENKFYTNVGSGSFTAGSILTGSISVSKNINEAGNISGSTGNKFPDGSISTTLNATINNGYSFLGWYNSSGQIISTNTSYTYIGPEGASFVAKYAYLDNIIKPNKSLSPISFDFDNSMKGLQFRKWDSPTSPLVLDMGANNANGSFRQVFIIGSDSIYIYSCCIFIKGDEVLVKKTSLDTTNITYSATKVGNLLTINFSNTMWGSIWVLWN